jgi:hypothetical protein
MQNIQNLLISNFLSLIKQSGIIFLSFFFLAIFTGSPPSGVTLGTFFFLGIIFIAWDEQKRITKNTHDTRRQSPDSSWGANRQPIQDRPVVLNNFRCADQDNLAKGLGRSKLE